VAEDVRADIVGLIVGNRGEVAWIIVARVVALDPHDVVEPKPGIVGSGGQGRGDYRIRGSDPSVPPLGADLSTKIVRSAPPEVSVPATVNQ